MPFLLIDATRKELEAALAAAGLKVLVEGKPLDLADYISEHRGELSDLAIIFYAKITRSSSGYELEWSEDLAALIAKSQSREADGEGIQGSAVIHWEIKASG